MIDSTQLNSTQVADLYSTMQSPTPPSNRITVSLPNIIVEGSKPHAYTFSSPEFVELSREEESKFYKAIRHSVS